MSNRWLMEMTRPLLKMIIHPWTLNFCVLLILFGCLDHFLLASQSERTVEAKFDRSTDHSLSFIGYIRASSSSKTTSVSIDLVFNASGLLTLLLLNDMDCIQLVLLLRFGWLLQRWMPPNLFNGNHQPVYNLHNGGPIISEVGMFIETIGRQQNWGGSMAKTSGAVVRCLILFPKWSIAFCSHQKTPVLLITEQIPT